ncbi:putative nicotinate-nucleotide adenylyltransferase [Thiomicrorhabdus immobilis]|uniref:Probable nicotinate-nucleotide adenylyltransferase n=1 Tax=Thiomicrorhabdus immobilis TaxID=2791037 RepID=A0ABN6CY78_9GAMM|nr:nicotinate-nucleotide adenylyltransferase [Thiomicrorhabdus immobilis]BCN94018.1 putative nicotinate-nucleotide adenylyltransferase [Thiomicrorhabdus immobilis]
MELIGINGGTFDPVHYGHLRPALEVMQSLGLQQVRFIPCYRPVHKNAPNVSAQQRSEMIRLAIKNQPKFVLDTIEMDKGGPSYMVDTLSILKQQFPDTGLVLMMGTDAFAKFDSWHHWSKILELANILVMHRPGEPVPQTGKSGEIYKQHCVSEYTQTQGQIRDMDVTQLDISSTLVRKYLQAGLSAEYLLPPCVMEYINKHGLYQPIESTNA